MRRTAIAWLALIAGVAALLFAVAIRWTPSRADFAMQGPLIAADAGVVRWGPLQISGANFAYLVATSGSAGRSANFARNRAGARTEAMPYGAAHQYALCTLATDQATNFDTFVPRDSAALPAAVLLDLDPDCAMPPTRALVISELTTFLNQIEAHTGKPALISPSAEFEARYDISRAINRPLWLRRTFFQPDYAARPWVMWQSSRFVRPDGVDGAVAWNVVAAGK